MPSGIGAFLFGMAFLALDLLLLLPLLVLLVLHLFRKRTPWTPGVLGLMVSLTVVTLGAGGAFAGAEYAGEVSDEYLIFWAPALLVTAMVGGVVTGLSARRGRPGAGGSSAREA